MKFALTNLIFLGTAIAGPAGPYGNGNVQSPMFVVAGPPEGMKTVPGSVRIDGTTTSVTRGVTQQPAALEAVKQQSTLEKAGSIVKESAVPVGIVATALATGWGAYRWVIRPTVNKARFGPQACSHQTRTPGKPCPYKHCQRLQCRCNDCKCDRRERDGKGKPIDGNLVNEWDSPCPCKTKDEVKEEKNKEKLKLKQTKQEKHAEEQRVKDEKKTAEEKKKEQVRIEKEEKDDIKKAEKARREADKEIEKAQIEADKKQKADKEKADKEQKEAEEKQARLAKEAEQKQAAEADVKQKAAEADAKQKAAEADVREKAAEAEPVASEKKQKVAQEKDDLEAKRSDIDAALQALENSPLNQ